MISTCLSALSQLFFLRVSLGACTGMVIWFLGANTLAYEVVIILAFTDVVTGTMKGIKNKDLSSAKFMRKLPVLIGYVLLLMGAYQISRIVPEIGFVQGWCAAFIGIGELISIVENLGDLGVLIPDQLHKYLKTLKDKKHLVPSKGKKK